MGITDSSLRIFDAALRMTRRRTSLLPSNRRPEQAQRAEGPTSPLPRCNPPGTDERLTSPYIRFVGAAIGRPPEFHTLPCRGGWCSAQRIKIIYTCRWQVYYKLLTLPLRSAISSGNGFFASLRMTCRGTSPQPFSVILSNPERSRRGVEGSVFLNGTN